MIAAGIHRPQAHGEGVLPVLPVAVDITQVIDVQHGGRQQTAGRCRQKDGRFHIMRLQIPAAEDAQPAEENEYRNITKADITIRAGAHRVGDGGHDRQATQREEADEIADALPGDAQQRQTKQTDQRDGDNQGALHLLGGNHPFLHPAQRPDAVRFIAPLDRVAVVIGEVGKNLQQAGGDQRQQGDPGIKMPLLPGKDGANNNRGKCQR